MTLKTTNKPYQLLLDILSAAGMGLGIYLTKPSLEKRLSKSLNLADSSVNKTFKHSPASKSINPINFELAGLGGIAAYKMYKGFKRNKKANVVEGFFLTAVLAAAVIYTASISKSKA
ncbi:hypothetical protein [Pedobacter agri]|uniref:hypothetical protein n=1 Tax=Pedobacter agri TaxID=454586 RepID=UPI002931C4D5|nr:hypothetical protein [Pedobacter agri]